MKYVFGPVPSRRLGNSLGIDPIPSKICNYGCVYCQLGSTIKKTNKRENFFPPDEILDEIKNALKRYSKRIDFITILASGEPLLYSNIGYIIKEIKKLTNIPTCLITNGALLADERVQDEILDFDVVMPTLDAGNEKIFLKINRPYHEIKFEKMIQGFISFRKKYSGQIWMEVMLIKGVNDTLDELNQIREKLFLIKPDRVYINIPIRPPTESWVQIPSKDAIKKANKLLGAYKDISNPESGDFNLFTKNFEDELLAIISRHPLNLEQIMETFSNLSEEEIIKNLNELENMGKIKKILYQGKIFWQFNP
ncbi:MAG: radical SAM protein [Candidatus Lokiarchaeota archaeon]|nr:radical SAM protein [Candidatus Lokiarchaeota archaeon]